MNSKICVVLFIEVISFFVVNSFSVRSFFTGSIMSYFKKNTPITVGFFPGSGIPVSTYTQFLQELQYSDCKLNPVNNINISIRPSVLMPENTVLIGHSFGGSICLWLALFDKAINRNNVKACILINSHFNQRRVMPYPPININKLDIPVLVMLSEHDNKLPLFKSLDDKLYVKEQNITNVQFVINSGNHTSRFTNFNEIKTTTKQIKLFLWSIKS
jgi:predicted alpha/beta hydrolase family esterase